MDESEVQAILSKATAEELALQARAAQRATNVAYAVVVMLRDDFDLQTAVELAGVRADSALREARNRLEACYDDEQRIRRVRAELGPLS